MELCVKMFAWSLQLFMFIQLANLPGSMKLHLRCLIWLASILNVTLKAAMSDIMKILVIVNVQPEAATRGALWKKGFLEIYQNSQENVCVPASFLTLLKKRLWHRFFPVNFAKLNTFFTEHSWTTASDAWTSSSASFKAFVCIFKNTISCKNQSKTRPNELVN